MYVTIWAPRTRKIRLAHSRGDDHAVGVGRERSRYGSSITPPARNCAVVAP
jgi:hypothetical protein